MLKKSQRYKSTEIIDKRINDCQSKILDKNNFANNNKGWFLTDSAVGAPKTAESSKLGDSASKIYESFKPRVFTASFSQKPVGLSPANGNANFSPRRDAKKTVEILKGVVEAVDHKLSQKIQRSSSKKKILGELYESKVTLYDSKQFSVMRSPRRKHPLEISVQKVSFIDALKQKDCHLDLASSTKFTKPRADRSTAFFRKNGARQTSQLVTSQILDSKNLKAVLTVKDWLHGIKPSEIPHIPRSNIETLLQVKQLIQKKLSFSPYYNNHHP